MLDREQLETFATVVEHGSFERAAKALHVTRGAISQRIKALEESLATVLLVREQPVFPTPRGEALLRHVKALRMLEEETLPEVHPHAHRRGRAAVAIALNNDSLSGWFVPVLSALLARRGIALELVTDDRDHTFRRLVRGEVTGCVSTEATAVQGFVAERLGSMEYRCVGTPDFAAEFFPHGIALPAVFSAPAILFDRKDTLHDAFLRQVLGFPIGGYVRHYIPAPSALLESILLGGGYGLVPAEQAHRFLATGRLLDLAPRHPLFVSLYWHHWQSEPALFRDITRLVIEEAKSKLVRPPDASEVPAPLCPTAAA